MKTDESLSEIFDVEPVNVTHEIVVAEEFVSAEPANQKIESDYDKTRSNLYNLLQQGEDALIHALDVAKQSEHPRAFEVVGNLMTQLAGINKQLMDLHEKKQKLDVGSKKDEDPMTTKQVTNNNAIFVGSTSDLNKMLQNMIKGE